MSTKYFYSSMCSSSENLSEYSYFIKDFVDIYVIYEHDLLCFMIEQNWELISIFLNWKFHNIGTVGWTRNLTEDLLFSTNISAIVDFLTNPQKFQTTNWRAQTKEKRKTLLSKFFDFGEDFKISDLENGKPPKPHNVNKGSNAKVWSNTLCTLS